MQDTVEYISQDCYESINFWEAKKIPVYEILFEDSHEYGIRIAKLRHNADLIKIEKEI